MAYERQILEKVSQRLGEIVETGVAWRREFEAETGDVYHVQRLLHLQSKADSLTMRFPEVIRIRNLVRKVKTWMARAQLHFPVIFAEETLGFPREELEAEIEVIRQQQQQQQQQQQHQHQDEVAPQASSEEARLEAEPPTETEAAPAPGQAQTRTEASRNLETAEKLLSEAKSSRLHYLTPKPRP
jgi:hypothetical protein